MSNQHWTKLDDYSPWRKISMGMWSAPDDPTIYGHELVPVGNLLDYLDEVSDTSGTRVTLTTYIAKMMADILGDYPDLNCMAIGDHIVQREHVDIFCQVAIPNESAGKADLSGVKLRDADDMELVAIADRLRGRAGKLRDGQQVEMEEQKSMVHRIPNGLLSRLLDVLDFLTYRIPVDLDALGIKSDPFGSCMVTSVGQFDIRQGFAPLLPNSHCPLVALPGTVFEAPIAEDGEPVVRRCINMSCTFDHRVYDGLQIGYIVRDMRDKLLNPRDHYPEPSHWSDADESSDPAVQNRDRAAE